MNTEVLLSNSDRTVGFIHVPEFEGAQTTVDLKYLKQAIRNLEDFAEKGLAAPNLTVGIEKSENDSGLLIFFLGKKGKTGIAVAPMFDERGD
jgi:hypothetical protein